MVAKIEPGTKKLRPNGNRVLVSPEEVQDKTVGGILLPDSAKEKPQTARVRAVGEGQRLEDGTLVPISLKKGDLVILSRYSGTEVTIDGVAHLIVDAGEILATLEDASES